MELTIPGKLTSLVENKKVGSKVKVLGTYEVLEKDEYGVLLAIDDIVFVDKKRKF